MAKSNGLRLPMVLLLNGIVDIIVAFILIGLPALGVGLPGLKNISNEAAFLAGGWGIAAAAFAVARIWAWRKVEMRTPMGIVGAFENVALTAYTIAMLIVGRATAVQALLPLIIGLVFAVLYILSMTLWRKERVAPPEQGAPPVAPESYRSPL